MKVAILGSGAYGLALALEIYENKHNIIMWTPFDEEKESLKKDRQSQALREIKIPEAIEFTTELKQALYNKDLVIIALPAPFVDDVLKNAKQYINEDTHLCIATKGIEKKTGFFISEIVENNIKTNKLAVISGPTFAIDLATKTTCGLSLATKNLTTKEVVMSALANKHLKLRWTDDIIGIEICGAIKNVIAIASGMLEGMKSSESTRAMLLTEALYDMRKIIVSFGGQENTILSYAGFGDLLLTCSSTKSRNFNFGKMIGEEKSKHKIKEYLEKNTVEGYNTLYSLYDLLQARNITIPIITLIYDIVVNNENAYKLLTFLVEKE